ncbi:acyl carrier protein [Actinokineospora iranica]|nr:acyl carrier protein [Actinokineospora iranica]
MTTEDLRRVLIECAGEAEQDVLSGDIADVEFDDLGYDSLALMETAARIAQDYGVQIPDERIVELRTPREVLELVNNSLAQS